MLVIALLVILTMSSPKLFAKKFRVHVENNKRNEIQTVNTSLYQLDANHFLKNLVSLIRLNEIPKLLRRRMFTHSICKALISTALKTVSTSSLLSCSFSASLQSMKQVQVGIQRRSGANALLFEDAFWRIKNRKIAITLTIKVVNDVPSNFNAF